MIPCRGPTDATRARRRTLQHTSTTASNHTIMPSASRDSRIAYGTVASPTQFPYIVAILFYDAAEKVWYQGCGGTLIGANLVLTAAHCLYEEDGAETPLENMSVSIGGTTVDPSNFAEEFYVTDWRHPSTYDHSIW